MNRQYNRVDSRVARLISNSAADQITKINDYVKRQLIDGNPVNTDFLNRTISALRQLVEQMTGALAGRVRVELEYAAELGLNAFAEESGGSVPAIIDRDQINLALSNIDIQIKDLITTQGIKTVNRIITSAMVSGATAGKLADMITEGLGEITDITRARAELIAHSEMMSIYRQQALVVADKLGLDLFAYFGPTDGRNELICREAMEVITTKDEWLKVSPTVFQYGLHYGCRHILKPTFLINPEKYKTSIDGIGITAYREGK